MTVLCKVFVSLPDDLWVFRVVLCSLDLSVLEHRHSATHSQTFVHLCDLGDLVPGLDMPQETSEHGCILKPEVETLAQVRQDGVTAVACQDGCILG